MSSEQFTLRNGADVAGVTLARFDTPEEMQCYQISILPSVLRSFVYGKG